MAFVWGSIVRGMKSKVVWSILAVCGRGFRRVSFLVVCRGPPGTWWCKRLSLAFEPRFADSSADA